MPSCYWSLCDCPDEQPCPQHDGTGCSILDGKEIEKPEDVDDPITRLAESAIAHLEHDDVRANEIKQKLEDYKVQLEKEAADLDQQSQQANTRAERRAVVDEEEAIAKRHAQLEAEVQALVKEIDALGSAYKTAAAKITAALRIPFTDPTGYCSCYTAKLSDLTALDIKIKAETATLATATAAFNSARAIALPKLKITFTLAVGIFLVVYIFTGGAFALAIAAFLTAMFTAITVLGLAIQLAVRKSAMIRSRIALLKLWLAYYRIQQIPTCVKSDDDDGCDDDDCDGCDGDDDGAGERAAKRKS